ncbi:MAG: DNA/RNA nuclease SfsA [Proteobacteria bacterium]|jgi:sugar fermentation stimulation protein A|nr:DNA/RNA nuclease SfsA [Alphaproteobacteria bacterium]NBT38329.1 DNA/RNA nuclease SfsA [Candidatus Fonsibacter sp. PEL3]NBZ97267.1 DNA/RNA nuclease SfsA [Candidatus Fonsibacter sp. PEL4]
MKFDTPLIKTKFIKRYKRFFVDVMLNKEILTAHCPNSGSMMGLLNENENAWVSKSKNPKRKLKYTLEILEKEKQKVGVNTHLTNKIVEEALVNKKIKEFEKFNQVQREVKFNNNTRFDFLVSNKKEQAFIEVKNVTLKREQDYAEFPDAPTTRGQKHLLELINAKEKEYQAYLIFLIQREDCNFFKISKDIDKKYYENFIQAKKKGVKFLCYSSKVTDKEIILNKKIEIKFE